MSKFEKFLKENDKSHEFDTFFHHYLTAALWSSNDDKNQPLDHNYSFEDIDKESYNKLKEEAKRFFDETYDMISHNLKGAGHDFWLTRNGHGAGFWDGDWHDDIGDKLTEISKKYHEIDLYVGDDGKLYI